MNFDFHIVLYMEQIETCKHPKYKCYGASKQGEIYNLRNGKHLKINRLHNGYFSFSLSENGNSKTFLLSRFVYECHKGIIPPKMVCDHIDCNIGNNEIDNLQIITQSDNLKKRRPFIHKKVKIEATNLTTGLKKTYNSYNQATKELKIFPQRIKDVCLGYTKSSTSRNDGNKYIFSYIN